MMIVMMMSTVFHQMRMAWDVGMRRVKLNIEGRAALAFMARELSHAVADTTLRCFLHDGVDRAEFYYVGEATETNRAIYWVQYRFQDERVLRQVARHDLNGYPGAFVPQGEAVLARNVRALRFFTDDGRNYTTNLPRYVDILIDSRASPPASRIVVASAGPNRMFGDEDDIRTDK